MTCRDVISLLAEYLEAALTQERLEDLERHLTDCAPCQAYLNTYRRTRTLTGETERAAMPEEIKDRLREFLLRTLTREP